MTGSDESDIEPSYRVACSISPEKNRSRLLAVLSSGYKLERRGVGGVVDLLTAMLESI
jgi:hypothetical protein